MGAPLARVEARPRRAAVLALVVGSVWAVFFSSWLAVKGVAVAGASTLGPDEVRSAAAVTAGEPLARVDGGARRAERSRS